MKGSRYLSEFEAGESGMPMVGRRAAAFGDTVVEPPSQIAPIWRDDPRLIEEARSRQSDGSGSPRHRTSRGRVS